MSLESDFNAALAVQAVAALVGDNVAPSHNEIPPQARKYVIYTVVFPDVRYTLDGPTALTKARIQVDCYAPKFDEALAIRDAVIAAIPNTGWPVHKTAHSWQDMGKEPDTGLYRQMIEFSVFHRSS